jgi:hypothetical protein
MRTDVRTCLQYGQLQHQPAGIKTETVDLLMPHICPDYMELLARHEFNDAKDSGFKPQLHQRP